MELTSAEEFQCTLALGKRFEERAIEILRGMYPGHQIQDTSEIQRVKEGIRSIKFPDFLLSKNNRPMKLYDAKTKKVYYDEGNYYLPVSSDFIMDYLYVGTIMNLQCGLIFEVNEGSRTHVGEIYVVKNIATCPYKEKHFNNRYGDAPSYWYNVNDCINITDVLNTH